MELVTIRHALKNERGSIAAIGAAAMAMLIGMAALAVEVGHWYVVRQSTQRVADMAALGGAFTYAATPDAQIASNAAADNAELNGAQGGTRVWDGAALTDNMIVTGVGPSPANPSDMAVQATVSTTVPLLLAKLFLSGASITISASAWAQIAPPSPACVLSLSQTGTGLNIGGNPSLELEGCTLRSDSNIDVFGSASVTALGVYAAGTIAGANAITTEPTSGQLFNNAGVIGDPYANYAPIQSAFSQLSSGGTSVAVKPSDTTTLSPGTYSSLDIKGTVTLQPGTYIVNGPITFDSQSVVTGSGVTLVSAGTVTINGGAKVNLTAPRAGAATGVPGIVMASPSTSGSALNGGSTEAFQGAIYFPNANIQFAGNSSGGENGCTELVANVINFLGSASFGSNCVGSGTLPIASTTHGVTLVK